MAEQHYVSENDRLDYMDVYKTLVLHPLQNFSHSYIGISGDLTVYFIKG